MILCRDPRHCRRGREGGGRHAHREKNRSDDSAPVRRAAYCMDHGTTYWGQGQETRKCCAAPMRTGAQVPVARLPYGAVPAASQKKKVDMFCLAGEVRPRPASNTHPKA